MEPLTGGAGPRWYPRKLTSYSQPCRPCKGLDWPCKSLDWPCKGLDEEWHLRLEGALWGWAGRGTQLNAPREAIPEEAGGCPWNGCMKFTSVSWLSTREGRVVWSLGTTAMDSTGQGGGAGSF